MSRLMFIIIFFSFILTACGGGDGGSGGGLATIPSKISWVPPTQNLDNSTLTDLKGYRFYYGPSASSLRVIPQLDLADSTGAVNSFDFDSLSQSDKDLLLDLISGNSTHFFAMTAVNSQDVESGFSNIVQYRP